MAFPGTASFAGTRMLMMLSGMTAAVRPARTSIPAIALCGGTDGTAGRHQHVATPELLSGTQASRHVCVQVFKADPVQCKKKLEIAWGNNLV